MRQDAGFLGFQAALFLVLGSGLIVTGPPFEIGRPLDWTLRSGIALIGSALVLLLIAATSRWYESRASRVGPRSLPRFRVLLSILFVAACAATVTAYLTHVIPGILLTAAFGYAFGVVARRTHRFLRSPQEHDQAEGRTYDRVEPL